MNSCHLLLQGSESESRRAAQQLCSRKADNCNLQIALICNLCSACCPAVTGTIIGANRDVPWSESTCVLARHFCSPTYSGWVLVLADVATRRQCHAAALSEQRVARVSKVKSNSFWLSFFQAGRKLLCSANFCFKQKSLISHRLY